MRFGVEHGIEFPPLLILKRILNDLGIPLMFLINASNYKDTFFIVNETIRGVSYNGEIPEFKQLRWTTPEHQMGINDNVVLCASNDMNVPIGDYDRLGVIRQVLKLLKLLYLVVTRLDVVQETVVLFYRKQRYPWYGFVQVVLLINA